MLPAKQVCRLVAEQQAGGTSPHAPGEFLFQFGLEMLKINLKNFTQQVNDVILKCAEITGMYTML